jgi:hypothetical protein
MTTGTAAKPTLTRTGATWIRYTWIRPAPCGAILLLTGLRPLRTGPHLSRKGRRPTGRPAGSGLLW